MTVGRQRDAGINGYSVPLTCASLQPAAAGAARRRRLAADAAASGSSVTLPTDYTSFCASPCSQAVTVLYYDSAETFAGVAGSIVLDASAGVRLASGIASVAVGATSSGPLCSAAAPCALRLALRTANLSASLSTGCALLSANADGSYSATGYATSGAVVGADGATVSCSSTTVGSFAVVQYTPLAAPAPGALRDLCLQAAYTVCALPLCYTS